MNYKARKLWRATRNAINLNYVMRFPYIEAITAVSSTFLLKKCETIASTSLYVRPNSAGYLRKRFIQTFIATGMLSHLHEPVFGGNVVLKCTYLIGLACAACIMGAVLVTAHASTFTCTDKSDMSMSGGPSVPGDIFAGATDATARNRLREVITEFRKDGLGPISIVNTLVGAYCPLVAADGGLSNNEKTLRVQRFARDVTALAYASPDQPETDILVDVTLAPGLLERVDDAAKRAGISRELWIERAISQQLDVP